MAIILESKLIELFGLPSCASTILQTDDTGEYLNINMELALIEFDYISGIMLESERLIVDSAVFTVGYDQERRREIAELLVMELAREGGQTLH